MSNIISAGVYVGSSGNEALYGGARSYRKPAVSDDDRIGVAWIETKPGYWAIGINGIIYEVAGLDHNPDRLGEFVIGSHGTIACWVPLRNKSDVWVIRPGELKGRLLGITSASMDFQGFEPQNGNDQLVIGPRGDIACIYGGESNVYLLLNGEVVDSAGPAMKGDKPIVGEYMAAWLYMPDDQATPRVWVGGLDGSQYASVSADEVRALAVGRRKATALIKKGEEWFIWIGKDSTVPGELHLLNYLDGYNDHDGDLAIDSEDNVTLTVNLDGKAVVWLNGQLIPA